jgi:hypothetical protein
MHYEIIIVILWMQFYFAKDSTEIQCGGPGSFVPWSVRDARVFEQPTSLGLFRHTSNAHLGMSL